MLIKNKIILFALCTLFNSLKGQNTKPILKADTLIGFSINILDNDKDLNGDILQLVRFNGVAIKDSLKFTKKDTGVFRIYKDGTFKAFPAPGFNGRAVFTYYVNDGKAGAGKTSTVTYIREPIKMTSILMFIIPDYKCQFKGSGYFAEVVEGKDTSDAYIMEGTINNNDCQKFYSGTYYWLVWTVGTKPNAIPIDQQIYYFIKNNGCK